MIQTPLAVVHERNENLWRQAGEWQRNHTHPKQASAASGFHIVLSYEFKPAVFVNPEERDTCRHGSRSPCAILRRSRQLIAYGKEFPAGIKRERAGFETLRIDALDQRQLAVLLVDREYSKRILTASVR